MSPFKSPDSELGEFYIGPDLFDATVDVLRLSLDPDNVPSDISTGHRSPLRLRSEICGPFLVLVLTFACALCKEAL